MKDSDFFEPVIESLDGLAVRAISGRRTIAFLPFV